MLKPVYVEGKKLRIDYFNVLVWLVLKTENDPWMNSFHFIFWPDILTCKPTVRAQSPEMFYSAEWAWRIFFFLATICLQHQIDDCFLFSLHFALFAVCRKYSAEQEAVSSGGYVHGRMCSWGLRCSLSIGSVWSHTNLSRWLVNTWYWLCYDANTLICSVM